MAIIFGVLFFLLITTLLVVINIYLTNKKQLIKAMSVLEVARFNYSHSWYEVAKKNEELPGSKQIRTAYASLTASESQASNDWAWSSSTDNLLLNEWRFTKAVNDFLYLNQSHPKSKGWDSKWEKDNHDFQKARNQANLVVEKYNSFFTPPIDKVAAKLFSLSPATHWHAESESKTSKIPR